MDPVLDRELLVVTVDVLETVVDKDARPLEDDVLVDDTESVILSVDVVLTDAELLAEEDTLAEADKDAESLGGGSVIVAVLDPDVDDDSVDVGVDDEDRVKETVAV